MKTLEHPLAPQMQKNYLPQIAIGVSMMVGGLFIALLSGVFFVDVFIGLFTDGAILFLYLAAACGWGLWIVGKSPMRYVTATAIGLGIMGLMTLALGLAGFFNLYAAACIVFAGLVLLCFALPIKDVRPKLANNFSSAVIWWLVPFAIFLALALVAASIPPGFLWKPLDPHPYDAISYHLQIPREWFDAVQIIPLQHNAFSYFPMGMEMHYLAAMTLRGGPWAGMYLCQLLTLAHGVLTIIAVAQIAITLGSSSMRAWSAALLVACVPWVFQLSVVAYVETGVMLYTTLAVGWVMISLRQPGWRAMLIVGICAGLAGGMKYTAIPMTAGVVVGLACAVEIIGKRYRNALIVAGVTIATLSPWLIRNYAWTGNPVFPLGTSIFGQAHFSDDQVERYQVAHRPIEGETSIRARAANGWWRTFADPQFGWLSLPIGCVAIAGLMFCKMRREGVVLGVCVTGMVMIWLGATHVIPRFITPIVPLMGIAIALLPIHWSAAFFAACVQAVIGVSLIWNWLSPTIALGQQGLFRLSDLSIIETDETKAARTSGDKVALIGDAQAFFYVVPSDRLIYRSVFDVNIAGGASTVDGWVGESVESLRSRGVWVVINTSELNRLSSTYRNIPRPLPPFDRVTPTPIVQPPLSRMR